MKVSLNWIRVLLDLHKTPHEIADILTALGLEVEGLETVKPSLVDLDKVRSGLVLSCERIPETDHLSATTVDVGDGVIRSIVCGAPNVAAGQKVFVALPGANVFSKDGELFTIGERKVKGIPSQGMICAVDELGVGSDHSGILVLPPDTALGISAADWYEQAPDTIIEIGLTPNRADATNHAGVARDLAAYLRVQEGAVAPLHLPDVSAFPAPKTQVPITVEVLDPVACPRYTGVSITGIQVAESPEWLKNRLLALGQRPINNVVDVTNFVRMELGQPLHAFDIAAIGGHKIQVNTLPEGTIFKALDDTERKLFAEDLMICDGNAQPMCMGGVFGGADSGVKDGTTQVFLESAWFNAKSIRRSMLRHNLRTDAAWSFEKGVDPNGCLYALKRAALLICELTGGEIASEIVDFYPQPVAPARVPVRYQRINQLIGVDLGADKIKQILTALEIGIEAETADGLTAVIPTNKPDVTREADVVEEVLRVFGLDNVPVPAQFRTSMEVSQRPTPDALRNIAADFLAANGFNECMSLSLSNSANHLGEQALFPVEQDQLVFVHNTANQGLDCMRPTMLFSALDTILRNQNRQNADLRLFELGKTYLRKPNSEEGKARFSEVVRMSVCMSGAYQGESWQPSSKSKVDFYSLKALVQNLLARFGVGGYQETVLQEAPYQYALKYHRGPQELVTFGAVLPSILKKMDIKNPVFFADFNIDNLFKAVGSNKIQFTELNKYPTVRRDLALVLDQAVSFGDIKQLAGKTAKKMLKDINLFDVFEDESKLGAGKKSYAVSFTFEDPEKTLQDKDIDHLMQQLQQAFETKLNAGIRK
ncbi:MAG: phenylalanine--tRNA ligase subunit beta [Saprospiraceae bacterium]|nr:phenylalanine--tRNA ligase subunit beta [Saprospiraceae bacterium]